MTRTRRLRYDKFHVFPLTSADSIKGSEFSSHFAQEGWMDKEQKKKNLNKSVSKRTDSWACRSRAACCQDCDRDQQSRRRSLLWACAAGGYSLSYLPDGLAWCDTSQIRLPFLHLLHHTPPSYRKTNTFSPTRQRENCGRGVGGGAPIRVLLPRCYNNVTFATLLGFHLPTDISGV